MREVLCNTAYRRLFTAQVVALIGTGLLTVALGLLAFDLAGGNAGIVLGIALTIKMLAYVGVAPVMSALTDRVPRKVLLVAADVLRAGVALSLPFVTEAWQIFPLIFVLQAASATFTPAFQALIPEVLPEEGQYTRALSLSRLAYDLESLLSPILAAALLTVISYHSLFVGTVVGFVGSAALVLSTSLPALSATTVTSFRDRLTLGMRVFWRTPPLRALLALNMVVAASTAMVIVNSVVLVQATFGRTQLDYAITLAGYGLGSMLVALALPRILERQSDRRVMMLGCSILPVGLVALALLIFNPEAPLAWPGMLIIWVVLGAATALVLTPSARLLRRHSNDTNRPAVFAAQFSLSHACFLVTYPLAGILGATLGLAPTSFALAALAVAAGIIARRSWSRGDSPDHRPATRSEVKRNLKRTSRRTSRRTPRPAAPVHPRPVADNRASRDLPRVVVRTRRYGRPMVGGKTTPFGALPARRSQLPAASSVPGASVPESSPSASSRGP